MPQQGAAPLAPLTRLSLHTHKNSIPAFGVCTIFAGFHFIREVIPIAIYHCNISIVSRGKGKSAVAAAAYRSGEKLTNEWDGMTHDYTRKGGVVHTEIMLPPHAPPSFSDRSTLWNSVELYEKAGNAQLAREIDAALPIELSREEQIRLVREYCSSQFVSRGMCVDYAIHDTGKGNPHCHIMLTMRPLDERGAWAAKSQKEYDLDENGERIRLPSGRYKTHKVDLTGWNDKGNALLWRKAWADISNAYLERAGSPERIDHRSNAERGIGEIPTVHMGVAACQMEKKGIATEKGELNRNIQKANRLIREIRAQIGKLKEWIADLFKAWETAPEQPQQSPGLANLLMKYLSVQREKSRKYSQRWQQQHTADELKTIAAAVNYLTEHGISTLDELDAALSSVSEQADTIRAGMKTAEERMKKLQKLIEYGKNYTECAVILIGHLNKAAGGQSAYRGLGSIDFRAAARSVLLIGRVKREPNVRVIVHDKSSLAPEGKPIAFCLDPETGFSWIGEYDITADELLSGAGGNTATKTEQAERLILDLLADGKELASEDLVKAAAEAGISERTVQNAKRNMGGVLGARRVGGQWYNFIKKKQPPEPAS